NAIRTPYTRRELYIAIPLHVGDKSVWSVRLVVKKERFVETIGFTAPVHLMSSKKRLLGDLRSGYRDFIPMSLKSLIQNGHFCLVWPEPAPEASGQSRRLAEYGTSALASRSTTVVDVQWVGDDLPPPPGKRALVAWRRVLDFPRTPQPKPPFQAMWLEATAD